MTGDKYHKINTIILLLIIVSASVYVAIRAYYLSFTHDECQSLKIITGDVAVTRSANDHIFNTWLMAMFFHLFGAKEIYLRLPNILGFILYSYFAYKILIKTSSLALMLLGACLLFLNPYFLDFFSLARGYGLSLAFGLGAIYYLFRQVSFDSYKQYILSLSLSLLFSLLSAYSNLFGINLNIAIMLIFMIELFQLWKSNTIKFTVNDKILIALVFIINLFVLNNLVHQIFVLKNNNELNFGGQNNFIDNVLTILIHRSMYFSYYGEILWKVLRDAIIAVFAVSMLFTMCCSKKSTYSRITILLFLMVFATILQHYLFDAFYPPERSSLIYITLFGLFVFYLLSEVYSLVQSNRTVKIVFNILVFLLLCLPLGYHFSSGMNLKYTKEWKFDSNTKEMMKLIVEQHNKEEFKGKKITISNYWYFEPSINYYRILYSMDYLMPANRKDLDVTANFIYCTKNERERINPNDCYTRLKEYKDTDTFLMKKLNCE